MARLQPGHRRSQLDPNGVLEPHSAALPHHPPPRNARVVLEHDPPPLVRRLAQQLALALESAERLDIVAHDPGEPEVRRGRDQVGDERGGLAAVLDQYRLVPRHVARRHPREDAREHLGVAVQHLELPGVGDGLEVGAEVARAGALVGLPGELEVAALDDVGRVRKGGAEDALVVADAGGVAVGVAARMVEVEMGIDDPLHVGGRVAGIVQRVEQLGRRTFAPAPRGILDAVDLAELRVVLGADGGIDEDQAVAVLDQQAAHRERDAVPLVGGDLPVPERLRHDAEHGAAVEALEAALEGVAPEAADGEAVDERHAAPSATESSRGAVGIAERRRRGAFRVPIASRSCSVRAPSPRARSSRSRRSWAVTIASPAARWRAGFSKAKCRERLSRPQERTFRTSRRARRTVQSRAPSSSMSRARRTSAVTKLQSKRALCATKTRPLRADITWSAISSKRGAPRTMSSVMLVIREMA